MALIVISKACVAPPPYNEINFCKAPSCRRLIKYNQSKSSRANCKKGRAISLKIPIEAVLNDPNYDYDRINDHGGSNYGRISTANEGDAGDYVKISNANEGDAGNYEKISNANYVANEGEAGNYEKISSVNYGGRGDNDSQNSMPHAGAAIIIPKPPSNLQSFNRFVEGILEMSRLQNYAPSMVLVLIGAWIGSGRSMEALIKPSQVWIAAGCSSLISTASMLVNDIFDFRSGTDQANGKTNPLLRGQIHPYHVELVAGCLYGASVIGLCYLEPMSLRLLIGVAAVATYIYTPFFKHVTMVKNVVVSAIISSSILAGALAIGGKEQLQNPVVTAVALFFFLCILSRELLMDVGDMVGDKAAGVNTLAVRFGGQIGTLTASFCLAAANAVLISLLAVKAQAFATIGTLILLPLHAKILGLCKDLGATKEALSGKSIHEIVQQSMVHIGFGVLVLASAA